MKTEALHILEAGVDVGERYVGVCGVGVTVTEDRELVHEVAGCIWRFIRTFICTARHLVDLDFEVLLKILDLVLFAFEIVTVEIGKNEIEDGESSLSKFKRMVASVANVFFVNRFVERLERKLINACIVLNLNLFHVHVLEKPFDKCIHGPSRFLFDKTQVMPLGEVPGMSGHDVEKTALSFRVSEPCDTCEMLMRDVHRVRISVMR